MVLKIKWWNILSFFNYLSITLNFYNYIYFLLYKLHIYGVMQTSYSIMVQPPIQPLNCDPMTFFPIQWLIWF